MLPAVFLTESVTLSCDRQATPEPACQLKISRIIAPENRLIPLNTIRQADIEVSGSSDGDTYRTVLLVDQSALEQVTPSAISPDRPVQIPLSMAYSSGYQSHLDTANQINTFLQDPNQTTFQKQVSSAWFMLIFGGVFILVGFLVMLLSPTTVCCLDRLSNRLSVEYHRPWGKKVEEAPLKDVIGPRLEYSRSRNSSSSSTTMRVGIELKSGRVLWFGVGYDNINNGQKYRIEKMVADFLAKAQ